MKVGVTFLCGIGVRETRNPNYSTPTLQHEMKMCLLKDVQRTFIVRLQANIESLMPNRPLSLCTPDSKNKTNGNEKEESHRNRIFFFSSYASGG